MSFRGVGGPENAPRSAASSFSLVFAAAIVCELCVQSRARPIIGRRILLPQNPSGGGDRFALRKHRSKPDWLGVTPLTRCRPPRTGLPATWGELRLSLFFSVYLKSVTDLVTHTQTRLRRNEIVRPAHKKTLLTANQFRARFVSYRPPARLGKERPCQGRQIPHLSFVASTT